MKTKINHLLGAVLSLLVTAALTVSATAQNGPIVFNSYILGTPAQVFVMNPDGGNLRQLTTGKTSAGGAAWHPSLEYVSFFRDGDLVIMQALREGGRVRPFTVGPAHNDAAFSPDGLNIVCVGTWPDNGLEAIIIRTVDVAKKKVGPATPVWFGFDAYAPSYSPDGRKLTFSSRTDSPDGRPHVKVLDLATAAVTSYDTINGVVPTYSPDGERIAFSSTLPDNAGIGLYVTSIDGTELIEVTRVASGGLAWISYSQDGTQLVFASNVSGVYSIYKVTLADGTVTLLKSGANAPHWRP